MADDDLMMEIMDDVTSGIYTVNWTTVIESDLTVYQGIFGFSVQVDSDPAIFSNLELHKISNP
jgi:methionine-rich copper-binding protein CopC